MTITALERESGVGRNTIYYYIGGGLLPPAQKASATRSLYNQAHVELLRDIKRLKAEGLSLREIREELGERIDSGRRERRGLGGQAERSDPRGHHAGGCSPLR